MKPDDSLILRLLADELIRVFIESHQECEKSGWIEWVQAEYSMRAQMINMGIDTYIGIPSHKIFINDRGKLIIADKGRREDASK